MAKAAVKGRKRVAFQVEAEPDSEVFVAGTFNGWDSRKNRLRLKNGVYAAVLMLPRGRHEYKYVVNGVWSVDPKCPDWVRNDLGSLNSVIHVG